MAEHIELGRNGEQEAARFLLNEGYEIVESNWRFKHEEIDLIVKRDRFLVFVEVKSRSSKDFGHPSEAVSKSKIDHLLEASNAYLEVHDLDIEVRFDVITVVFENGNSELEHFEDAFGPEF